VKILVTGHLGYVGSVMIDRLAEHPVEVYGVDCGLFSGTEFRRPSLSALRVFPGDFRSLSVQDLEGIDAIIHLAAISNDPMGDIDPEITYDVNTHGTIALAMKAKEAGVKRFVFGSSCSVYGKVDGMANENSPLNPVSDYAKSKIMAEHGLAQISSTSFQVIAVRNATAFGWSNSFRSDIVVNAMTADAMLKGLIKVNDPSAHRPLAHCHDISGAMIHFARFGAKLDGSLSDFIPVNFAPFNYTIGEIALAVIESSTWLLLIIRETVSVLIAPPAEVAQRAAPTSWPILPGWLIV